MAEEDKHYAGICWFDKNQWDRLKEVAEDRDRLEDTWEEWHSRSLDMIETFATRNIFIEKVPVDLEELILWCESKKKGVNSATRAEFVTQKMLEKNQ